MVSLSRNSSIFGVSHRVHDIFCVPCSAEARGLSRPSLASLIVRSGQGSMQATTTPFRRRRRAPARPLTCAGLFMSYSKTEPYLMVHCLRCATDLDEGG